MLPTRAARSWTDGFSRLVFTALIALAAMAAKRTISFSPPSPPTLQCFSIHFLTLVMMGGVLDLFALGHEFAAEHLEAGCP